MVYDPKHESKACTNALYYRNGPTPQPLAFTDAESVAETIEEFLREAYEAGRSAGQA